MKNPRKTQKLKRTIANYVTINKREYLIISILFIIGLLAGVLFINNIKEEQYNNLSNYINKFVEGFKNIENIDYFTLLKESITKNLQTTALICFFGTTVIGLPVVFGVIIYRGFCLGYTISTCISVLGMGKGLAFVCSNLLLHNLFL